MFLSLFCIEASDLNKVKKLDNTINTECQRGEEKERKKKKKKAELEPLFSAFTGTVCVQCSCVLML